MFEKYAVIGNPIEHSKSPLIHSLYAQQTHQHNMVYNALCFGLDSFNQELDSFIEAGGLGANVTVPFKQVAYQRCDELSEQAALAGAVNTLEFRNGKIIGNNTDGLGLVKDLVENNHFSFKGKRVLVLGAGGAVRGVLKPIIDQYPQSICIANRTFSKAQELADRFSEFASIQCSTYADLVDCYDLIINGTSASLNNQLPDLPPCIVSSSTVLYDMMYASEITVFNRWGVSLGAAQTIDGLGMLVGQAAESFSIWRGVMPRSTEVIQHIRGLL